MGRSKFSMAAVFGRRDALRFDGGTRVERVLTLGAARAECERLRSLRLISSGGSRVRSAMATAMRFLVDVHTEVMHDFVHGRLVCSIADESGATCALPTADPPAQAGNPRYPQP